jgi:hypothetical protein
MGILVCYDDFSYDVVSICDLHELLENGSIIGYDNSGDWIKSERVTGDVPATTRKTKRSSGRKSKTA